MKKPTLFSVILLLSVLVFYACEKDDKVSQPSLNIDTPSALTAALTDIHNEMEAPGFAVSVVKDNVLLYQESFGQADIENSTAYTNQTTQPIGSISKTFVAAAIVKAIEQGYFTLDSDINDILPIEVKNPQRPNTTIKVKHLVTHTSGLIDNNEVYFQSYHILPGEDMSTGGAELLQDALGFQQRTTIPLEAYLAAYYLEDGDLYSMDNFAAVDPGSTWNYSNIATSLAAYLVEVATGIPFQDYVKTNVLQPLNMDNTAYDIADLNAANAAKLYWDKNTPLPAYFNDSYPDGSINSNNEDLAKYLLDMMKGAKGQSTTLFSKEGYDLLFESLLPDNILPSFFAENQGVFWFLNGEDIKHDGSDPGTTCNLQFDNTGNAGYLLITNMDASSYEHQSAYFKLADEIDSVISSFIEHN